MNPDFSIENHGSIFLFRMNTPQAVEWVAENVQPDAQFFGDTLGSTAMHETWPRGFLPTDWRSYERSIQEARTDKSLLADLAQRTKNLENEKAETKSDDTPERQVAKLMRDFKPGGKIN